MQGFALDLVEQHGVHTDLPLKSVEISHNGISYIRHINCTSQLDVVQSALSSTACVTDEDVK